MKVELTVNGEQHSGDVEPWRTLLSVLREDLGLTGTKSYCHSGACGACTVLLDGEPASACSLLAPQVRGRAVTTIEGLTPAGKGLTPQDALLHPIQQAYIDHWGLQCGYCTPGMVLLTKALLDANPQPTDEEIVRHMSGNICRCTGYAGILESVRAAAAAMAGAETP